MQPRPNLVLHTVLMSRWRARSWLLTTSYQFAVDVIYITLSNDMEVFYTARRHTHGRMPYSHTHGTAALLVMERLSFSTAQNAIGNGKEKNAEQTSFALTYIALITNYTYTWAWAFNQYSCILGIGILCVVIFFWPGAEWCLYVSYFISRGKYGSFTQRRMY